MNFRKFLEKTGKKLDREVGGILKEELKKAGKTDKKLVPLLTAFTESCQGGKGIRGGLVVLGYEIARGGDHLGGVMASQAQPATIRGDLGEKGIIKVAAAYEILHSAILVHDDIIDQSLKRRNEPSLYQALGGNHYGTSQAISLADYGFFLSFKIISESNFPAEAKIAALKLFSVVLMDTSLGEMLDLEDTDPLTVMRLKTACYTIAGPLQLGAVLGGASSHLGGARQTTPEDHLRGERLLKDLAIFGENLGIAYQIRDDILDSEAEKWGGVEKAKKEAEKYKIKAMKVLPSITQSPEMSKILEQMGEWLVERKS